MQKRVWRKFYLHVSRKSSRISIYDKFNLLYVQIRAIRGDNIFRQMKTYNSCFVYFCRVKKHKDNMEEKFCQSCGMPLTPEILGTNADGSQNEEYCIYCYKDGAFTGDFTMEEMVEFCAQFVEEYNKNTGQNLSREEYKGVLRQYYPHLKRWQLPADQLPHATSPIKQQLIDEVNALGIKDMPHIDNLFILQGSFVNMEYTINSNKVKLLDDNATYWGNQVEKGDGRCFGIACDEHYILVSEYGKDGANAELVVFKRR